MNFFQSFYLTRFSSPVENRKVYQAVCRIKPKVILEFGIQRGDRSFNMLELSKRFHKAETIQYCCVDPFESRTQEDGPGLSLRKAYKVLAKTNVRLQTVPDSPVESLRHVAGSIRNVEILVVATPSVGWAFQHGDALSSLLAENGIIILGGSATGKVAEFSVYSLKEFRETIFETENGSIRRVA